MGILSGWGVSGRKLVAEVLKEGGGWIGGRLRFESERGESEGNLLPFQREIDVRRQGYAG